MPVPPSYIVCRFIRKSEWSAETGMAKAKALKSKDMSVWHEETLINQGASLQTLQFGSLEGSGHFTLTVQEYLDIASAVAATINQPFQVQVEWRPEDDYVPEPWRPWREAHAQVEMLGEDWNAFPEAFRSLVIIKAQRKETAVPSDAFANGSAE